jgi:N6-adenosine-specific RNA methylase IME4
VTHEETNGELVLHGESTATALVLREDLDFGEWEEVGRALGRVENGRQWWTGDWLNHGERKYGEGYAQGMDATGLALQTLTNCAWVARRFSEISRRRENLSWGHHDVVAADEPADQDYWLDQAEEHDWTVRELRKARRPEPPPPPEGTFSILYADPPWEYDFSLTDSRRVENQYPTMTVEEIAALSLPDLAPDGVLFLWATAPKLREALRIVEEWGFAYKSHGVWDKARLGMGYWFRGQHELLLVATRGEFSPPDEEARVGSVLTAERRLHSEKPVEVVEWIEGWWPDLPKVELFARARREGWTPWGVEA